MKAYWIQVAIVVGFFIVAMFLLLLFAELI